MSLRSLLLAAAASILLSPSTARAAENDTTFYRSAFEERTVNRATSGNFADHFLLFGAITSDSLQLQQYQKKLNAFYSSYDAQINAARAPKSKARIIFKEVHAYFLKQYEEYILFNSIFEKGKYNCVTASMLYALILTHYRVPFEIKEKPTHIYLVVYPGTENILFETTDPKGFMMLDEKAKRQYLGGLVRLKYTTQEHIDAVGLESAFNELYYNNENISMTQLGGIQYANQAISRMIDEQKYQAIGGATKAYLLYPCARTLYIKTGVLGDIISESAYDKWIDIVCLSEYANALIDVRERRIVIDFFQQLLQQKLIKEGNDSIATATHGELMKRIQDEKIKSDLSYDYFLGMGAWHAMKSEYDECLEYAGKAFAVNQKDTRVQEMISRAVIQKSPLRTVSEEDIKTLSDYEKKFPFLTNHRKFKALKVYQYGLRSIRHFIDDEGTDGYRYMAMIEAHLSAEPTSFNEIKEVITMTYAEAGSYHFRRKEFQKAKAIVLKGLKYAPESKDLKNILGYVETEIKG